MAKKPEEHVEEVNTDICREPARPLVDPLPRRLVPPAARRDVFKLHVITACRIVGVDTLLELADFRMESQLQDSEDATTALSFQVLERVEVPRVDHDRFLTDGVGTYAQGHSDVRIVQVVWRADAQVIETIRLGPAAQFLEMAIESLNLGEEADVKRVLIEHADGIVRIDGGDQPIASLVNRSDMA